VLGVVLAVLFAGPASAALVTDQGGVHGPYFVNDTSEHPGAKCGYGAPNQYGFAAFKWMKFYLPQVRARNVTSMRDHQKVRLIYKIQLSAHGMPFKAVEMGQQTRTAYDDTPAAFDPAKLYHTGHEGDLLRGAFIIQWLRAGDVEGFVKVRLEYYAVKWTVGSSDYVFNGSCTGEAD
jgi:hypothetical protein